jgi:hypothetical protein
MFIWTSADEKKLIYKEEAPIPSIIIIYPE